MNKMENKTLISVFVVFLVASILFLGAAITGFVVQKVEYNDLCRQGSICQGGKECCIIYEDKNLGVCMDQCQSFEFLCKSDEQCEEGTVCCKSEGMEYGICNNQDKCLSVDIFAEYVGKVSFLGPETLEKMSHRLESPMKIDSNKIVIYETISIIGLIAFIIWLLVKKNKKSKW